VVILDSDVLALIRLYVNDESTPYTFSDEIIQNIYTSQSENLYLTVAELWLIKASKVSENNTTAFSLGNESYSFSDSKVSCMENYKLYLSKANQNIASLFEGDPSTDDIEDTKFSNLMGGAYSAEPSNLEEE
jgi:hypothetical protein